MIRLITFLGNPGQRHAKTRHNAGWMIAESLSDARELEWKNKFNGTLSRLSIRNQTVYLLKPGKYMNRSGESVRACMEYFGFTPGEILIVHDDIELELGKTDIKKGGGLAGHNGLRSVAAMLGTKEFYRYRIGIGRPVHGNVNAHVLGSFTAEERMIMDRVLDEAEGFIIEYLGCGSQNGSFDHSS